MVQTQTRDGFLKEFFERFPHLRFTQLQEFQSFNPLQSDSFINNNNNDSNYFIRKRELKINKNTTPPPVLSTTTSATTMTTTTTAAPTTTTTLKRAAIPQEDIWFGSTPSPMYRGYVTSNINLPAKNNVGHHFYKGV